MRLTKRQVLFLVIVSVLIIIAPWILTLHGPACLSLIDSGSVGDVIGGTTAPIIGLVSIFLLFLTLKSQTEFNVKQHEFNQKQEEYNIIQRQVAEFDMLLNLQERINLSCNNIKIEVRNNFSVGGNNTWIGSLYLNPHNIIDDLQSYEIESDSFGHLYSEMKVILNLMILYYTKLSDTILDVSTIKAFVDSIALSSTPIIDAMNDISINNFFLKDNLTDYVQWDAQDCVARFQNVSEKVVEKLNH
jgi:hypothetical protein